MSPALGLVTYDTRPAAIDLNGPARPRQRNCGERTADIIELEARRLLDEVRVSDTSTAHRATLESLAKVLLKQQVVGRTCSTRSCWPLPRLRPPRAPQPAR